MPFLKNDHTILQGLDWESSGHTGFGSAEQGGKADTALQKETDPLYILAKPDLLLRAHLPNFGDYATKIRVAGIMQELELLLSVLMYEDAPHDDYAYIRLNKTWVRFSNKKYYEQTSNVNVGVGVNQMLDYTITIE